jgi:asparagine synthase (glutamine-hydrolysing)
VEDVLLPALSRVPCLVAFSGGRDSSIVLALATRVAREHGLADPIPVTLRFDHPNASETEWQEMMVRHLGLLDWTVLPQRQDLEVLGDIARGALARHGLYWPANAHLLVPLLNAARDGSLLTGTGGDELFSPPLGKRIPMRHFFRVRPLRRAFMLSAIQLSPWRTRLLLQYRGLLRLPWLTKRARRAVRTQFLETMRPMGQSWQDLLQQLLQSRYWELIEGISSAIARDADVLLVHPFLEPRYMGAAIQQAPQEGFSNRSAAIASLFGDLLPRATVQRGTKATFNEILWGPESKSFAERRARLVLDPALVDHDALRRVWARPRPDLRALTPLQAAWLAESREPQRRDSNFSRTGV